jgi:hypothetical protein
VTVIGTLKHSGQIERAVIARLNEWSSTYLADVEAQDGLERGFAERLRTVQPMSTLRHWPEEQLPAAFVIVTGTAMPPTERGNGYYEAHWTLGVAAVCSTATEANTRLIAQMYGAAIRGCLLQRRSLGGVLDALYWMGESEDDWPIDASRTVQASMQMFEAVMGDVVTWKDGPTTPTEPPVDPLPPLPDWPIAEDVDGEVEKVPTGEPIERSWDGRSP